MGGGRGVDELFCLNEIPQSGIRVPEPKTLELIIPHQSRYLVPRFTTTTRGLSRKTLQLSKLAFQRLPRHVDIAFLETPRPPFNPKESETSVRLAIKLCSIRKDLRDAMLHYIIEAFPNYFPRRFRGDQIQVYRTSEFVDSLRLLPRTLQT